jgi:hypothetical protein
MRANTANLRVHATKARYRPLKIALAVLVYVGLCMLVLIFSPPDYAGRQGLVQTSVPESSVVSIKQERT